MRLIHPKNFELISRFNTEGKLELKGFQLLSGYPGIFNGGISMEKYWVEDNVAIGAEHVADVYYEISKQPEILSPLEYIEYTNYTKGKYTDGLMPIVTYEEYIEKARKLYFDILFVFTKSGARQFSKVTRKNIDRNIAIIIDNFVLSRPVIREEIYDGIASICTCDNKEKAEKIVKIIKKRITVPELHID